ncbi:MAG: hypothetical protein A2231_12825 [Candidatus Firestonebacteria bacterium RIFOXYA2_FULL_40_8]|nr:MAG: hypothetical protein A2231_12825 [Candidatus Firestonebacteria bacterium RIFOXYA2_FULL_40_8]
MIALVVAIAALLYFTRDDSVEKHCRDIIKHPEKHPALYFENYNFNKNTSLLERIKIAPDFVLDDLKKQQVYGKYSTYIPTGDEKLLFEKYLNLLPKLNRDVLAAKLIGIYFINDYDGGGSTNWVMDKNNNMYVYMVINSVLLKEDISQWLTYKENCCFIPGNGKIVVNCGSKYKALLYGLLHESNHVVDLELGITPYLAEDVKYLRKLKNKNTKFTKDIWLEYNNPHKEYDFKGRSGLAYYTMRRVLFDKAYYMNLSKSPFVSLYGSQNWAEDFADMATFYYLTQILKQPYEIKIFEGDNTTTVFPMLSDKLNERLPIIQSLYK